MAKKVPKDVFETVSFKSCPLNLRPTDPLKVAVEDEVTVFGNDSWERRKRSTLLALELFSLAPFNSST